MITVPLLTPTIAPQRPPSADELVERYHRICAAALAAHRADGSSCHACGTNWPCSTACSAAAGLSI